jgi:hypothetical protein
MDNKILQKELFLELSDPKGSYYGIDSPKVTGDVEFIQKISRWNGGNNAKVGALGKGAGYHFEPHK